MNRTLRIARIKKHAETGGYMFEHIRSDIMFLLSCIQELEDDLHYERLDRSYKGKLDSGV